MTDYHCSQKEMRMNNAESVPAPDAENSQPSALSLPSSESFPLRPGETPRAFSAFMAFFALGQGRSLQGVADQLEEKPDTLKSWSSRYGWSDRLQAFHSGLLQQQAEAQAAAQRQHAADWARRQCEHREQEWVVANKLLAAARCYLESFGDREVEKMTLGQVSRAFQISSRMARLALSGAELPEKPTLTPLQQELTAALLKAYSQPVDAPPVAAPRESAEISPVAAVVKPQLGSAAPKISFLGGLGWPWVA